jgi:nucleoside-diphosphate-sugar epimerase
MQLVIVTGCSGRIGQALFERFSKSDIQLVGFDIQKPSQGQDTYDFFEVDIASSESVEKALLEVRKKYGNHIVSFIHLASYYNFEGGHWDLYEKLTIEGTRRLIIALKEFACEQFIFASSMLALAGTKPGEKINEDSPLSPSWEYPKSKIMTEELLGELHGDIPLLILRIAGCYDDGCHSPPLSQQIVRLYEHQLESRFFPGDLKAGAAFIHLEDLAECVYTCVERRQALAKEEVLLVGEERTLSYDELQREISYVLQGKEIHTFRIPKIFAKVGAFIKGYLPGRKSFIKPWMIDLADVHYELDCTRAKKLLAFQTKRSLYDVIPLMCKALLVDPMHWYHEHGIIYPKRKGVCCARCSR